MTIRATPKHHNSAITSDVYTQKQPEYVDRRPTLTRFVSYKPNDKVVSRGCQGFVPSDPNWREKLGR
jgi:hypothetical protein